MVKKSEHAEKYCPVARTLNVLEDNWSILILRNAFFGAKRFSEFQRQLGVTRHVLSARLKSFLDHGIMERASNSGTGARDAYLLTEKGCELYPVIVALAGWGAKWTLDGEEPPVRYRHLDCGKEMKPITSCSECGEEVTVTDVSISASETLKARVLAIGEENAAAELGYPPPRI